MRLLLGAILLLPAAAQITPAPADPATWYLVFLRRAPDRKPLTQAEGDRIQEAHMNNIRAMAARGVLVAAGPFEDTPPAISGIFVFHAPSLEEARRIARQDPTVIERRNNVEVYEWRGPAGLGAEYRRLHAADPKTPEDMGVQPLALLYRGAAEPSKEVAEAHTAYVNRLRAEGKLATAGPVEGDPQLRGVLIFQRIPDGEARALIDADPAVKAGALRAEYHRWWCAAHVLP